VREWRRERGRRRMTTKTKQHHFILVYDTKTEGWELDTDCEELRFPDGTIWNEESQSWETGYLGNSIYEEKEEELAEAITKVLAILNSPKEENE
jgi:hypothetical protein